MRLFIGVVTTGNGNVKDIFYFLAISFENHEYIVDVGLSTETTTDEVILLFV